MKRNRDDEPRVKSVVAAFRALVSDDAQSEATALRISAVKKIDDGWKRAYGLHSALITSAFGKGGRAYNHTDFASMKAVLLIILSIYGGVENFNPLRHLFVDVGAGEGCVVAFFAWFLGVISFGIELSPEIFLAIKTKFAEVQRRTLQQCTFGRIAFALGDATTFDPRGITLMYAYDGQAKAAGSLLDELSRNIPTAWELFRYHRWMLSSPTVEVLACSALSPAVVQAYMQQPSYFVAVCTHDLADDRLLLCPLGEILECIEISNNSFGGGHHHTSTFVWYRPERIASMNTAAHRAQPAVPMDAKLRSLYNTIIRSENILAFDPSV